MNKRLVATLAIGVVLVAGTIIGVKFGQGYRLNLKKKQVTPTGLLVANSFPEGASVYINQKLTTATDDTLNLPPGDYQIKIVKDGYIPWKKKLTLEKELVTQTSARLFPAVPDLQALTFAGAQNITPSPDGQRLAFTTASASARLKNGLWVLEMGGSPFSFSKDLHQVGRTTSVFDFNQAELFWSPDSKQILVKSNSDAFLLNADRLNQPANLKDVTATLVLILDEWEKEVELAKTRKWQKLPEEMVKIASQSAKHLYFSPDEEKIFYTATATATIPQELSPPLPATNSQPEQRQLEPGKIYVYDIKEDKNFFIVDQPPTAEADQVKSITQRLTAIKNQYSGLYSGQVQWFPTSQHLLLINQDKISIIEYDGTNQADVYAGRFEENFVYPWPDGSKLVIATSLNPSAAVSANLYAIDLK